MQLFGKSSKSPAEAVKLLKESLVLLERGSDGKKQEKALEEVRYFSLILFIKCQADYHWERPFGRVPTYWMFAEYFLLYR